MWPLFFLNCLNYTLSILPPPPFSSLSLFFSSCTSSEAYRGALSQEELDELDRKAALKTEAMMNILSREEDLRNIRDSQVVMDKVRFESMCIGYNNMDNAIHMGKRSPLLMCTFI